MNRRAFLHASVAATTAAFGPRLFAASPSSRRNRITKISVQLAKGRRLTPVAPNAYAPYRGYDVGEPILRIQTAEGIEGVSRAEARPDIWKQLLGLDAAELFKWDGDRITGPAAAHRKLLDSLGGCDVALLDVLGKSLNKPIADLLGERVRDQSDVYDSSLYMEDLLEPEQRKGLAYLNGDAAPTDPAELVARKAEWVLRQPGGIRILKIKLGRAKWMGDFDRAVQRDVAVVQAIRKAVGDDVVLFVDGNNGYDAKPLAVSDFALATRDARVYAMEEMFSESRVNETRQVKKHLRENGMTTKIADGESERDGITARLCAERFKGSGKEGPLFDINQPDMNVNGFIRMMEMSKRSADMGMTIAPHNFGSKMGFYSMAHLAMVTPNWEFCETDDSGFPALKPEGFVIEGGKVRLTGAPGLGVALDETRLEKPSVVLEG